MSTSPDAKTERTITVSLGCLLSLMPPCPLLCPFDEVHEAIEVLAGESVWTHQIPRVIEEVAPHLKAQYPREAAFDSTGAIEILKQDPRWDAEPQGRQEQINEYLAEVSEAEGFAESYEIRTAPSITSRNPMVIPDA